MLPRFILAAGLPMLAAMTGDTRAASAPAPGDNPTFISLEKVEIPIFGNSRIEGRINARLVLQVANPQEAATITRHMPEVRTRIVESMLDYGSLYVSGFAPVDAQGLSAVLNSSVRAHHGAVQRVLIVELSASPL